MTFLIWIAVFLITLGIYLRGVYSRFSRCGVKHLRPVPFLGHYGPLTLKQGHVVEIMQHQYNAFTSERFTGFFELMTPVVMIRDLDLIKRITVKDFEYFLDHRTIVDATVDPLFGRSLFSLKGQEWKDMRATLSPVFTSAKMRAMMPFMVEACEQMIRSLKNRLQQTDSDYIDVDCKDLMTRTSNDVVASCGFGLKVDSHADPENELYRHGMSTAHFSFWRILTYLGYCSIPNIMKKLNLKVFYEKENDSFKNLFCKSIKERKIKGVVRPDIIQVLTKAKKGNLEREEVQGKDAGFATVEESQIDRHVVSRTWTDVDLAAQALFFFLASFEILSSAMCFMLYEMAVNTKVQDKLVKEIREHEMQNHNFSFDSIQELKYLDMVVSELLRLWPFGIGIDRHCTKDYNIGKPNVNAQNDYIIKKGELISVPIFAIHRDPNYFPDPDKFDPERFSEENKGNIKPYTYIPFGSGPRGCIASRFASCVVKVLLYHLLLQFEVSPAEKTRVPVQLAPGALLLAMDGGHWIRFRFRN